MRIENLGREEWATTVADRLSDLVRGSPGIRIALPTGRTPQPVFAELVRRRLDMSHVELFLLDEFGGIPFDHPARCERMLRSDLVDRLDAPPQLHVVDVDAVDADGAAVRYGRHVRDTGLDLVVLGLGMNGHVALNEPGSTADSPTRVVGLTEATMAAATRYGAGYATPTWGVTLGMQAILDAGQVWLLVTGTAKSGILQRVLTGEIGSDVPASFLRTHPNAIVLADNDAATP